jgi:zinc transport system substrate-binding protein
VYQQNREKLLQQLSQLKSDLNQKLKPVNNAPFLVYHDGYQYFEKEFNLNAIGTLILNPHLPLSAKSLNQIKQVIKDNHVKCVFRETEFNDNLVRQSLSGINVQVAELDPLGARLPKGPENYQQTLEAIGDTLSQCLQQ